MKDPRLLLTFALVCGASAAAQPENLVVHITPSALEANGVAYASASDITAAAKPDQFAKLAFVVRSDTPTQKLVKTLAVFRKAGWQDVSITSERPP